MKTNQKNHSPRRGNEAGFTLIELITVISTAGILIALLLPAVQKVRENASHTPASGAIKQVVLASSADRSHSAVRPVEQQALRLVTASFNQ